MINGAIHLLPAARDLGLEQLDALGQFLDREGIEVLARELRGGVVMATRKIVGVHRRTASGARRAMSSGHSRINPGIDRRREALTSCLPIPIQAARGNT